MGNSNPFPAYAAVSSAKRLIETFAFTPQGYGVEVVVRIYEVFEGFPEMRFEFETSHYAHTPTQISPYITSCNAESSVEAALSRAVSGITSYLDGAVRAGHDPSDSWLVKNEFFT